MPELPEVETIRRQLAPLVVGRRLTDIEVLDERWSRPLAPAELAAALEGRRVQALRRRGKYLLWALDDEVYVAQHLRMTGAVLVDPDPEPAHVRVRMLLRSDGRPRARARGAGPPRAAGPAPPAPGASTHRLVVDDPRRFGTGELLLGERAMEEFFAARLGLEPLDELFTVEHLREVARGRRAPVKAMLLDQRRVAGVGNIYADEALFRAGVHPLRAAGRLRRGEWERVREGVIDSLLAGIAAQGASIDDFRHLDGGQGAFQEEFLIHRREGEPCARCGREIRKMVVAGRGTYVCERCQPRPRVRRRQVR